MKKFLFITMVVGSLITLNAQESRANQVLDSYIAAWNEHDIKKIDSFYAPKVIWYDLGYDYTTKGKESVSKAIIKAFMGSVPDMYWSKSGDVFISGDTVVYEWVYGGTFNGKWDGKVVKDKSFQIKGVSATTINKNGKITSHKDYYNLLSLKQQLGVLKSN
ncbi:MAG: ester cyclase [Campylobacterota bacterium]|nr:ester cyclase [Campylobacterota bacterium]